MSVIEPPSDPEQKQRSVIRGLLPYTTAAMIVAVLYVAWTFYSRYEANRRASEAMENRKAEENKRFVNEVYGSGQINFTSMTADSGAVAAGETTQLCYGVVNAKAVKIDPPVEQLKPSYHHCFVIAPKKTTTYTITASDGAGHTKSESLTVQVR
jgi:hypothetical protein